jgi:hypothetical protein
MDELDNINLKLDEINNLLVQVDSINKQIQAMCEILRIPYGIVPLEEQPTIEELTDPDA